MNAKPKKRIAIVDCGEPAHVANGLLNLRNHWFPLIKLYTDAYSILKSPRPPADEIIKQKSGFCAYVMSNTKNSSNERVEIFDSLNAYKTVSSGGKWRNNVGGPVADKLDFQSKHKFAIAFENNSHPGY